MLNNSHNSGSNNNATSTTSDHRPLRHDEQVDEAYYDERDEADDDLEKGKIQFPQHTLFGREMESKRLRNLLMLDVDDSFKVAVLQGPSGVGKSALVWETLLYHHHQEEEEDSPSQPRSKKRRSCWSFSGKYNHASATQEPFSAIVQSLEQLAANIAKEAKAAMRSSISSSGTSGPVVLSSDNSIIQLAHRLAPWYDSDDASILISFCGTPMEQMHAALKRLHKKHSKNKRETSATPSRYLRSGSRKSDSSSARNGSKTAKPPIHGSSSAGVDASETSSVMSDNSSSVATRKSLLASSDIQQLAIVLNIFLQYLTTPEKPLIWFLDDLQWADVCSLQLLQYFLIRATASESKDCGDDDKEQDVLDMNGLGGPAQGMNVADSQSKCINGLFVGAHRPISSLGADKNTEADCKQDDVPNDNPEVLPLQNFLDRINEDIGEKNKDEEPSSPPTLLHMNVSNLSPKAILNFCCATLDMPEEETWPLMNALYSATLGNIFHCRQALEHLVRSNCLYYDVMFFSWTYNLPDDGSALQDIVEESCQDVLVLVQSKLEACSDPVRGLLIRAACTESTVFGAMLLLALLQATGYPGLTQTELRRILDEATNEGLLLNITYDIFNRDEASDEMSKYPFEMLHYKFSHDKVKEATYNLLPESGPERDYVLLPLAAVLIQWALQAAPTLPPEPQPSDSGIVAIPYSIEKPRGISGNQDWMWFVGVQHLNTIPLESLVGTASASFPVSSMIVLPPIEISRMRLAQWNLRVAEMSVARSSYVQAIQNLKAAISYLEPEKMWMSDGDCYHLSLQLYNKLMETSFAQGHYDETKSAIAVVLTRAADLQDKITAFHTKVRLAVQMNDHNNEFGISESLSILRLFGMKFPSQPSSMEVGLESTKLKVELRGRAIGVVGELDIIPLDDPKGDTMKLLVQLQHMILLAKKAHLASLQELIAIRAMRWTLENGVSKYFALFMAQYCAPLRNKGKLQAAGKYAAIVKRLFQRFADEGASEALRSSDFLFCEFIVSYIGSAMHYPLAYFVSGRPLNALLEAKLVLFEDKAKLLHLGSFHALFHCAIQVQQNLQGKTRWIGGTKVTYSTEIQGEEQILSKMEGGSKQMTTRDFAIYGMMLAVYFRDVDCMELLMARLQETPFFDLSIARQTLRMTYCGFAAFLLARDGRHSKKNHKAGSEIVNEFRKMDKAAGNLESGSVNFRPILLCLAAVERNKVEDYDAAIAICHRLQLCHLKALMCELCGRLCTEQSRAAEGKVTKSSTKATSSGRVAALFKKNLRKPDPKRQEAAADAKRIMSDSTIEVGAAENEHSELAKSYLGKAMWLYQDWSALAKVAQLREEFSFLKMFSRRAAGIHKSSTASVGSASVLSTGSANSHGQATGFSTYFPADSQLDRTSDCESLLSGREDG
ncbi:MAG: hypothetical protein SGILL_001650 [Bacillariaceae sp.]